LSVETTNEILSLGEPKGRIASWQGLPGRGFGGMHTSRTSDANQYEIISNLGNKNDQEIRITGMPVDVYASRSLSGLAWAHVDLPPAERLVADLDNQLVGQIRNPLPVQLHDCMLCFGRWVYPLPTLPVDGTADVDRSSKFKTIAGMLTRNRVDKDFKGRSQAWNRKNLNVNRIMEIMMFHKAAGGTKYTTLLDRFQNEMDFSDHLTQGRAVLFGNTKESLMKLLDSKQVHRQSQTYVRILLPVTRKRTR
jgi:hypothetical protein